MKFFIQRNGAIAIRGTENANLLPTAAQCALHCDQMKAKADALVARLINGGIVARPVKKRRKG